MKTKITILTTALAALMLCACTTTAQVPPANSVEIKQRNAAGDAWEFASITPQPNSALTFGSDRKPATALISTFAKSSDLSILNSTVGTLQTQVATHTGKLVDAEGEISSLQSQISAKQPANSALSKITESGNLPLWNGAAWPGGSGGTSYTLPPATTTTLGGVKPEPDFRLEADGTLRMPARFMGIGQGAVPFSDWNDCTIIGMSYASADAANAPTPGWCYGWVVNIQPGYCSQFLVGLVTKLLYKRDCDNGTWGAWTEFGLVWSQNGPDIYRPTGNVGIRNNTPSYPLDVNGDINFTGVLRKNGVIWNPAAGTFPVTIIDPSQLSDWDGDSSWAATTLEAGKWTIFWLNGDAPNPRKVKAPQGSPSIVTNRIQDGESLYVIDGNYERLIAEVKNGETWMVAHLGDAEGNIAVNLSGASSGGTTTATPATVFVEVYEEWSPPADCNGKTYVLRTHQDYFNGTQIVIGQNYGNMQKGARFTIIIHGHNTGTDNILFNGADLVFDGYVGNKGRIRNATNFSLNVEAGAQLDFVIDQDNMRASVTGVQF